MEEPKNRLKKILEAAGFRLDKKRMPISHEQMLSMGIGQKRFRQILRNEAKNLKRREIKAICKYFGLTEEEFFVPEGRDPEEELVLVNMHFKIKVVTPEDEENKNQQWLFEGVA